MEDGRDGGNPEFDGEVTDQYTAEVIFLKSKTFSLGKSVLLAGININ